MYPGMEALGQGYQGGLPTRIGGGDENATGSYSVSTTSSNHCDLNIFNCGSSHCRTHEFSLWSHGPFLSEIKIERAGKLGAVLKWADSHLSPPFQSLDPKALLVLTGRASFQSGSGLVNYRSVNRNEWRLVREPQR